MVLCGSCNVVLRSEGGSKVAYTIHSTYQSFITAVNDGCYICHGLFSQISEEWKQELYTQAGAPQPSSEELRQQDDDEDPRKTWKTWYHKSLYSETGSVRLVLKPAGDNTEGPSQDLSNPPTMYVSEVKIARGQEPGSALWPWVVSSRSTNSEETFSKIKSWLDTCEKKHDRYHVHRYAGQYEGDRAWCPTRLVQIISEPSGSGKAEDLVCRIVETKSDEMPQNLRYVTLSHRWPQNQHDFQKLTLANMPHWKANLPVKMLRQTFQDALLVAHRMGINYVWIDSLCIIQDGDNLADWKKESPMMHKVYSQAEFNICASRTIQNENEEGLFSTRDPSSIQPLQIDLGGHCLITKEAPIDTWNHMMETSPLNSRGWVFQEQLLSRANVHFGSHQVFFECMVTGASESLGSHQDYRDVWKERHSFFKQNLRIPGPSVLRGGKPIADSEAPYQCWLDLLQRYTARELTNFDDRLVALSGVAQYFKKVVPHGDLYVAGLWSSRLITELLWEVSPEKPREDYDKRERARRDMTFSWVSAVGEIKNIAATCLPHPPNGNVTRFLADCELIKYGMVPDTANGTLPACEEHAFAEDIFLLPSMPLFEVKLTGFLRPIRLTQHHSVVRVSKFGWMRTRDLDLELTLGEHQFEGYVKLDFEIASSELDSLNNSDRLFLMPLAKGGSAVWSILLELVEKRDETVMNRFRRIGIQTLETRPFALYPGWVSLAPFKIGTVFEAPHDSTPVRYGDLNELPCWHYNESSKKHTILVI